MCGKAKTHKDVEFHVDRPDGSTAIHKRSADAADLAISLAMSGHPALIDVVVWTEAGARWYCGADGVKQYREDPDASVFERIQVRAESLGRVR